MSKGQGKGYLGQSRESANPETVGVAFSGSKTFHHT
jgi:hypothetical protein